LPNSARQIDAIDAHIVALLGERFAMVREVAAYKRPLGIPAVIPERVAEVGERCVTAAKVVGLRADFIRRLRTLIIDEACRLEDDMIRSAGEGSG
jgi:chorismate mutase-like protein